MDAFQIEEWEDLEIVEAVEERYAKEFGRGPLNLSHWDPSSEFVASVGPVPTMDLETDPVKYIYSYNLGSTTAVLEKLGFDPRVKSCLITPNGTTSMLCAVNWAAHHSESLSILCPFYFPVAHQARHRGLTVDKLFMQRRDGRYHLPEGDLGSLGRPLWLTNPVYCTGVYPGVDDRSRLRQQLEAGRMVIADECLASSGHELGRHFGDYPNFIGLYSPHKTVCLNGMKFSAVVFDRRYEAYFHQWADVLYGGLSASTTLAIRQYLSEDFELYGERFRAGTARTLAAVTGLGGQFPAVDLDHGSIGHFATLYLPKLRDTLGESQDFLWDLARTSGAVIVSNARNHFDSSSGFSFRLNLAMGGSAFVGAVGRVLRFLSEMSTADPAKAP